MDDAGDSRSRYRIQAVDRVAAIINAFTPEHPELGVTEIAERVGLHKSTVHRFLASLEATGLLERRPGSSRYRLGLRLFELGGIVQGRMSLWDEAIPVLEGLVAQTGETSHLAVLRRGEALYVEGVRAQRSLHVTSAMGRGYPAHATSLGKVLLAHVAPDHLEAVLAERGLRRFTRNTIASRAALTAELERVRTAGHAIDRQEYEEGVVCVGAPVRDHSGQVIAAIGIGGPTTRVTEDRLPDLIASVLAAAGGLSRRLGADRPRPVRPGPVRLVPGRPASPPRRAPHRLEQACA